MADHAGASGYAADPAAAHSLAADEMVPEPQEDQPASTPRLAPGLQWSDIVAEIRRDDNRLRDAA
jgi:hypothetical protein